MADKKGGRLKRIEIDVKDSGAVVVSYREPEKTSKDPKECYEHCYWDNREENAFDDVDKAVARISELISEMKK